ncbi:hydroxypyruvate isomerase family protein [Bacillus sp. FJAT-29814]|uniref:hydroxypyruvate isomerase family protein n=1 Tax=Bacillus sp. FJAT-29814 TaxID=1729688 RepID=UPI0008341CAB|nr:TIM barrel protein [Bacillus sp. FJAT-29814]
MNKFAVNLSTIFTEVHFLERFKKARDCGFSHVECQFPYHNTKAEIQRELSLNMLSLELINLPPGNWVKGDRGLAADPKRVDEFKQSVHIGIEYAADLNVSRIHCMAGIIPNGEHDIARDVYLNNLHFAGTEMAKHGIMLLIEPLNPYDMPGYFLHDIHQAKEILDVVDLPNVKLQFDFYHMERIHGNPLSLFQQYANIIGHVQIADVPGRHQPGTGEMNYKEIFHYLNDIYEGYIGLEYTPSGKSEASFDWLEGGK